MIPLTIFATFSLLPECILESKKTAKNGPSGSDLHAFFSKPRGDEKQTLTLRSGKLIDLSKYTNDNETENKVGTLPTQKLYNENKSDGRLEVAMNDEKNAKYPKK